MILAVRTDNPEAEVYLVSDEGVVSRYIWHAHRALAETLLGVIVEQLAQHEARLTDITGIICFEGPGSYTGLRIGLSVANALAYSYAVPIVAAGGENWLQAGMAALEDETQHTIALPVYGGPAFTSVAKKW